LVVYGQVETEKCAVDIVLIAVIIISLWLESRVFGGFGPGWRREAERDNSLIVEAFDVLFLRGGELLEDLERCETHHGHRAD
jgi:hypothetical protein